MKLYIHLRFQPYPMVCLPGNAQIRYIHLRFRLNPMVHLPETLKFTTSIYAFSHIRWRICSETLKFATSICALGQIRWNARIYSAKSDGAPAYTRLNPMERPQFTTKNFRPQVPRDRKQDFLPSVTNKFAISDQFRSFSKLLSSRLVP